MVSPVEGGRVIIVAFDGIVADTLPRRATALADAITGEGAVAATDINARDLLTLLPGRTFAESMAAAIDVLPALQHDRLRHDVTGHDLIVLRAQRSWAAAVAHGVPLRDGVADRLQAAVARGVRIVLRSDSQRREVEPLLRLAGLEDVMLFLRCADDLPRLAGVTSLQSSYEAITARLERQRLPRTLRTAIEVDREATTMALGFVDDIRTEW